jgi:hypothetical protein
MTSTASAINEAWLTNLSAASVFGEGQVSNDYGVMESTSACCCIVNPVGYVWEAMTFGNNRRNAWQWLLEVKVKDQGDSGQLNRNAIAITDKVLATLQSDDELQGTVREIGAVEMSRDPKVLEEIQGHVWQAVDITVTLQDWD